MRQAEKQAAAGSRDLLRADALWEKRKASAAAATARGQKRKAAAAAAAEQMRSGSGTPPSISFNDGSCFFNGAGSFFSSSPNGHRWQLPPSDPATWDQNPTPPGGFTNLMQPHVSQNFHFTGGPSHFVPLFKPPASVENIEHVTVDSGDELWAKRRLEPCVQ